MKICIGKQCTSATTVFVLMILILTYFYYTSVSLPIIVNIPKQETKQQEQDFKKSLFEKRLINPLLEPKKTYINLRTRGKELPYQQYGFVYQGDVRIPLFGRQTYAGSNQYEYYVQDESRNFIKIPLDVQGDKELYDDDKVTIDSYDGEFTVKIYENDAPKYIPY